MQNSTSTHHTSRMAGFDRSMERWLGADMRLLYGMGVPILMITGLIIVLALSPGAWLVATILVIEVLLAGAVIVGFTGMLNESDEEDTQC
ncbi:MAG TPA: hypothetical protein VLP43_00595 [Solirubrobacteraceae bacterium]|nr:hypothetical protein [Solirubrobacteraceae bacterium]